MRHRTFQSWVFGKTVAKEPPTAKLETEHSDRASWFLLFVNITFFFVVFVFWVVLIVKIFLLWVLFV